MQLAEPLPVTQLPGFSDGLVSVPGFRRPKAAYLVNPQDGERILHACAAPGGKTGHLLEMADCKLTASTLMPNAWHVCKATLTH